MLFRELAEALGGWAGDGLCQIELIHAFVLAEIRTVVQFLQQDELGAVAGSLRNARFDDAKVRLGIAGALIDDRALLDQRSVAIDAALVVDIFGVEALQVVA